MTEQAMSNHFSIGSCCCGAISYRAQHIRDVWYCHCQSCRKMTGHFMAAAQVDLVDIEINGDPKWYYVTPQSRYGFCPECGAHLFWRNDNNDYMSLTAGCMDNTVGLGDKGHIFVAEKGDYYQLPDNARQSEYWDD